MAEPDRMRLDCRGVEATDNTEANAAELAAGLGVTYSVLPDAEAENVEFVGTPEQLDLVAWRYVGREVTDPLTGRYVPPTEEEQEDFDLYRHIGQMEIVHDFRRNDEQGGAE